MRDEANMTRKRFERFCGCLHSNNRDAAEAPPSVQAILQTLSKYSDTSANEDNSFRNHIG